MSRDWFDASKSFLELPLVRFTFGGTFLLAVILVTIIATNTAIKWDLSANGFNYALEVFKFPLGVLALLIPLMAIFAAAHRSEQIKKQIEVTADQNRFANYYKHKEEFVKFINNLDSQLTNKDIYRMHKAYFDGIEKFTTHVDQVIYEDIKNIYDDLEAYFEALTKVQSTRGALQLLSEYESKVKDFGARVVVPSNSYTVEMEGSEMMLFEHSFLSPLERLYFILNKLNNFLFFDDKFWGLYELKPLYKAQQEFKGRGELKSKMPIKNVDLRSIRKAYEKVEKF